MGWKRVNEEMMKEGRMEVQRRRQVSMGLHLGLQLHGFHCRMLPCVVRLRKATTSIGVAKVRTEPRLLDTRLWPVPCTSLYHDVWS
jgi:hypothetical protein